MKSLRAVCVLLIAGFNTCRSLSASSPASASSISSSGSNKQPVGNVFILDHLNVNHEKGRHDWLKAFYFDFLQCAVDPRKAENIHTGKKTLWANIGSNQFHLPEGKPDAQVLEGVVTLAYPNLKEIQNRYEDTQQALKGSKFSLSQTRTGDSLDVTDPWGSRFQLVPGDAEERDSRGTQPGDKSEGLAMRDLTLYTPTNSNFEGIARFYKNILGAPVLECSRDKCCVSVGPQQTLAFVPHPKGHTTVNHDDLRNEESKEGRPHFLPNYGPHVSMYVSDLRATYDRAEKLGVCYVNPRFKRRAYTKEEAVDDCMFRCIDIVDPDNKEAGPILKLEHEIRSVVKRDGSKYKSCPFDEIP